MKKYIIIPDYKIIKKIAGSKYSEVYLSCHEPSGQEFVIKTYNFYDSGDLQRRRFNREIKILNKLKHENICRIIDHGETADKIPFIIMEYYSAGNLKEFLKKHQLTESERIKIIEKLFKAISFAHKKNVIHRDLKPENILLTDNYDIRIADFGLSAFVDSAHSITCEGEIMGSPIYISPEQARGVKATKKSDLYSLAVMVFEILSGEPPYQSENISGYIFQHINAPIPKINFQYGDDSDLLDQWFNKAMSKKADKRFSSIEEMSASFYQALNNTEYKSNIFKRYLWPLFCILLIFTLFWFYKPLVSLEKTFAVSAVEFSPFFPGTDNKAWGWLYADINQNGQEDIYEVRTLKEKGEINIAASLGFNTLILPFAEDLEKKDVKKLKIFLKKTKIKHNIIIKVREVNFTGSVPENLISLVKYIDALLLIPERCNIFYKNVTYKNNLDRLIDTFKKNNKMKIIMFATDNKRFSRTADYIIYPFLPELNDFDRFFAETEKQHAKYLLYLFNFRKNSTSLNNELFVKLKREKKYSDTFQGIIIDEYADDWSRDGNNARQNEGFIKADILPGGIIHREFQGVVENVQPHDMKRKQLYKDDFFDLNQQEK